MAELRRLQKSVAALSGRLDTSQQKSRGLLTKLSRTVAEQAHEQRRLRAQLDEQHAELRLMLSRLPAPTSAEGAVRIDGGLKIPLSLDSPIDPSAEDLADPLDADVLPASTNDPLPADEILRLDACPICGDAGHTPVCRYNKLLLLEAGVDEVAPVYDYAMCHACGVVSARTRPSGPRYQRLLERFELTLGRQQAGEAQPANLALSSRGVTDSDAADLRARLAHGALVSDHLHLPDSAKVQALLRDRLANSIHVEILTSFLQLRAPRVLELRPRLGSIGVALQRFWDADVTGMPLFEGQQFLIREAYGIPVDHRIAFDQFAIPAEGTFDLVVANHMLTHAVRPRLFLDTVRDRLNPGGHLYLYNEWDEHDFLDEGKSMFSSLNAFHFQAFDGDALVRALAVAGFRTLFQTRHHGNFLLLAQRADGPVAWDRMPSEQRDARVTAYERARDRAILKLPERLRARFAGEWQAVVERAYARGDVGFDAQGHVRLTKKS